MAACGVEFFGAPEALLWQSGAPGVAQGPPSFVHASTAPGPSRTMLCLPAVAPVVQWVSQFTHAAPTRVQDMRSKLSASHALSVCDGELLQHLDGMTTSATLQLA